MGTNPPGPRVLNVSQFIFLLLLVRKKKVNNIMYQPAL
jgi:hypothetical protein